MKNSIKTITIAALVSVTLGTSACSTIGSAAQSNGFQTKINDTRTDNGIGWKEIGMIAGAAGVGYLSYELLKSDKTSPEQPAGCPQDLSLCPIK